jgi:hypothetical protein
LEGISKKRATPSKDQQAASTSQRRSTNHFNSAPRDGYVTVSLISFGGQISRYVKAWQKITCDPWVLETVQYGLSLDFMSPPFQQKIPRNAAMNVEQTEICQEEVTSLLGKGVITQVNVYGFVSGFFLVPTKLQGDDVQSLILKP